MKRPLDLNPYSGRIAAAATVAIVVPGLLRLGAARWLTSGAFSALGTLSAAATAAGVATIALIALAIAAEQVQDALYDRHYRRNRSRRLALPGGSFECQHCGNRQLTGAEPSCPVCGGRLS